MHAATACKLVTKGIAICDKAYTICSIYIPPSSRLHRHDLDHLVDQLPAPYVLCGDFNGHNTLWGSQSTNDKGATLENFIDDHDMILLNMSSPTRYDDYHHTYSTIDLSICHPSVYLDWTCNVLPDRHGSDHFPLSLQLNSDQVNHERIHIHVEL